MKTKMTSNKGELYLIISVLFVIGLMFLIYYYFTIECFTNAKILADDIKSEEEYRKCINENSLLEEKTNGKIKGCNALLSKLTITGNKINNNTPYGKITDLCPISSLSKIPSDCLEHRVENQSIIMDSLNDEIRKFKSTTLMQKTNIDSGSEEHKKHLNDIYSNKEILDAVKYINKNKFAIDNDEYNQIYGEKSKLTPKYTPKPTKAPISIKLNTPPPHKITKSIN